MDTIHLPWGPRDRQGRLKPMALTSAAEVSSDVAVQGDPSTMSFLVLIAIPISFPRRALFSR
jgi:hypothetical protein